MVTYHLGLRVASILEVRLRKPFLDHFVRRPVKDPARARALAFLAFLGFRGRGALPRLQRGGAGGRAEEWRRDAMGMYGGSGREVGRCVLMAESP